MRVKFLALVCLLLCSVMSVALFGQAGDPLTGTWTGDWGPNANDRNAVSVDLKWDGKTLTGTVNSQGSAPVQLQKSTFDAKTGAIHMEADAKGRGGVVHYVIQGKVEKNTMTGSWNHDNRKGDFRITKK